MITRVIITDKISIVTVVIMLIFFSAAHREIF